MKPISAAELYELFLDTVGQCTSKLLCEADEIVDYNLFEDGITGAVSFLHESSLAKLRGAGLIDDQMVNESKIIRERWLSLESRSRSWTINEIKNSTEWRELFSLCDQLLLKAERHSADH